MKEQLRLLVELQEIDSSILSLVDKIESLPGKLEQFERPLRETKTAYQKFQAKLEDLGKKKKSKDMELEEIQEKINKLKSRSSEIKTNKEYEAHLREIESFERNKNKIEDEILTAMEDIENFAHYLQNEGAKVKKAEDDFKQQEKLIEEEKKKLNSEMEMLMTRRKDFVLRIDEEIYGQYKTLLKRMGGLAVVQTKNEICLGCNTNIPPQLYNDIKKNDEIFMCYYCKRFLYYKEPPLSDNKAQETDRTS